MASLIVIPDSNLLSRFGDTTLKFERQESLRQSPDLFRVYCPESFAGRASNLGFPVAGEFNRNLFHQWYGFTGNGRL